MNLATIRPTKMPLLPNAAPKKTKTMWCAIRDAKILKQADGAVCDHLWLVADFFLTQADAQNQANSQNREQFVMGLNLGGTKLVWTLDNGVQKLTRKDGVLVDPASATAFDNAVGYLESDWQVDGPALKAYIQNHVAIFVGRHLSAVAVRDQFDALSAGTLLTIAQNHRATLVNRRAGAVKDKRPAAAAFWQSKIDAWDAMTNAQKKQEVIQSVRNVLVPQAATPEAEFVVDDIDSAQRLPFIMAALGTLPLIWEVAT